MKATEVDIDISGPYATYQTYHLMCHLTCTYLVNNYVHNVYCMGQNTGYRPDLLPTPQLRLCERKGNGHIKAGLLT